MMGGLDVLIGGTASRTSAEMPGLIKCTSAEFPQTVVMIIHNNDVARLADRIVLIGEGKIVEQDGGGRL